MSDTKRQCL